MNICQSVMATVKVEDRIRALENCFYSWDGELDIEVIEQGIHDRYSTMGKPLEGIYIERNELNAITITHPLGTVCKIRKYPTLMSTDVHWVNNEMFTYKESKTMSDWLLANFHH